MDRSQRERGTLRNEYGAIPKKYVRLNCRNIDKFTEGCSSGN